MTHHINLYDPALLRRREWLTAANLAFTVAIILVVMLFWGSWVRIDGAGLAEQVTAQESRLKAAREESIALAGQLASRRVDPKLELDIAAMQELLGVRQNILAALGQGDSPSAAGHADYLRGLSRQSIANVWLTGFSIGPDGSHMEIRGRTLDPALLPEYIRRLSAEPAFRGRRFASLNMAATEATPASGAASTPPWLDFALVPELEPTAAGGVR
jgi:hypothetical protein